MTGLLQRIYARVRSVIGESPEGAGITASQARPNRDRGHASGRQWVHRSKAPPLTRTDLDKLMSALVRSYVRPVSLLGDGRQGVGIRVDFGAGLTRNSMLLLEYMENLDLPHLVALSLLRAGDLCVFSEGRARIDPELETLLRTFGKCSAREVCCLNELSDALQLTLGDPWLALEGIAEQLGQIGVRLTGYATPIDDSPVTQLNLMLLHGGYFRWVPDAVFDAFGVHSNDLQEIAGKRRILTRDYDFVDDIDISHEPTPIAVWNGRLGRNIDRRFKIATKRSLAWILHSDWHGWSVEGPDETSFRPVRTEDLLDWFRGVVGSGVGLIVIESSHVSMGDDAMSCPEGGAVGPKLRQLPYPFHHFLAMNSDIDWSTRAQHAAMFERLNCELGLPISSSFYLRSSSAHWIAAERVPPAPECGNHVLGELAGSGAIDTLHGIQSSINVVTFERSDLNEWRPAPKSQPIYIEGLLVTSRTGLREAEVLIKRDAATDVVKLSPCRASTTPDDRGFFYAYFPVPGELCFEISKSATCSLRVRGHQGMPDIVQIAANDLDPQRVAADIRAVAREHVRPLVFTSHGGGANVLALGNIHSPEVAAVDPQSASHDVDSECSPYGLVQDLMDLGVRFFNPVGMTGSSELVSIDKLTLPVILKNGMDGIFFSRFLSTRHEALGFPPTWSHGKTVAHGAALGFQVADIIQRLHWLPLAHGGVLYTHFGHNIGNQVCNRLAWTEETHAAFDRLARYYHPDFEESVPAFRLWVAPASSILLYSWVAKRASDFIQVDGSSVRVGSWYDEALKMEVPGIARNGTKLLSSITVYVESAENAEASVDGEAILSFTRNPADESGRESITFVDDSGPLSLLAEPNVNGLHQAGCEATFFRQGRQWTDEVVEIRAMDDFAEIEVEIFPVPLVGATCWTFEMSTSAKHAEVGFRDARGALYVGSSCQGPGVVWPIGDLGGGVWRRFTFSLAGRRPHADGPPEKSINVLFLRMHSGRGGSTTKLRRVALLRPQPGLAALGEERIVAGRVDAPLRFNLSNCMVVLENGNDRRTASLASSGWYRFYDLTPGVVFNCYLDVGGVRYTSVRGRAVITSCDQWDWDFRIPGRFHEAPIRAEGDVRVRAPITSRMA